MPKAEPVVQRSRGSLLSGGLVLRSVASVIQVHLGGIMPALGHRPAAIALDGQVVVVAAACR